MKKLTVLLGMVFFAVFAMAQNATISQVNDEHKAEISQTGVSEATIDQAGNMNEAIISQTGAGNVSSIRQAGDPAETGVGPSGSWAKQVTVGDENLADIVQRKGSLNVSSYQDQSGNGNTAKATFYGVNEQDAGDDRDHTTNQIQSGNSNFSRVVITHTGLNANAYTEQIGNGNWIHAGEVSADHNSLDVFQEGDDNEVMMNIRGGGLNAVDIDQIGIGNNIGEPWTAGLNIYGSNNGVIAKQEGDFNNADIQIGSKIQESGVEIEDINVDNNTVNLLQEGMSNDVSISVMSNGNTVDFAQIGSGLTASVSQKGGDDNKVGLEQTGGIVDILQDGAENVVKGIGTDMIGAFGGVELDIDQLGSFNTVNVDATALGGTASVLQEGNSNTATVTQN